MPHQHCNFSMSLILRSSFCLLPYHPSFLPLFHRSAPLFFPSFLFHLLPLSACSSIPLPEFLYSPHLCGSYCVITVTSLSPPSPPSLLSFTPHASATSLSLLYFSSFFSQSPSAMLCLKFSPAIMPSLTHTLTHRIPYLCYLSHWYHNLLP